MLTTAVEWRSHLPILFLVIFITSPVNLAHDIYESIDNPDAKAFGNRVCTNKECVKIAAMLIQDRNDKISPCDDFGAYACDNFKINNDDSGYHYEGWLNIHRKLKRMLKLEPEPNEKPWYSLARSFYKKCVDTTSDIYPPDLRVLLDEIGGWPALTAGTSDWTEFGESFEEYIANIHRSYHVDFLFKTSVWNQPVNKNGTEKTVIFVIPSLPELNSTHLNYLFEYGSHFNPKLTPDNFNAELIETLTFHKEVKVLYNKTLLSRQFPVYLPYYKNEFPNFDFEKYFTRFFDGIPPFGPETIVAFQSAEYFRQFHELLRPENKRKVVNYAVILVLRHLFGETPRSDDGCIYFMNNFLKYPIAQMYVEKHVDRDVILKVTEMVKLVKEELRETLKNASWLDDKTRANAILKVDKMVVRVGYPENLFNDTYVEENWNIPPSPPSENIYELVARIERKQIATSLLKLQEPRDTVSWTTPILFATGYYLAKENMINILLGYLELPLYASNLPHYFNYAIVGSTIGHEIMHGFDNKNRFYDAFGKNVDWWDNATSVKYNEKANCFVDQYSAEGIDGRRTLGENIADSVGFTLAYGAYKRHLKKLGVSSEPALPAFEKFSMEQMFFIASSHEYCNNEQRKGDPNDSHSPTDTRMKMIARNSKHFSKAFNCDKRAPMNPEEKCSIW